MNILAIESSCDETCAAVVRDGRKILSNIVASQIDTHAVYGGVVPEIASRAHAEAIAGVTEQALSAAQLSIEEIDAVAVTNTPGLIGALLVGVNFAKSLAYARNIPLIPVHHIKAHVAANYAYFNGEDEKLLEPGFLALVASGGHTSLINVKSYTDFELIGTTCDDAAGEVFDKVARILGYSYPGGAKIDAAAISGDSSAYRFPDAKVKDSPYDFSFSGLKTAAINMLHTASQRNEEICIPDFCASFTHAVVHALCSRIEAILSDKNYSFDKIVIAGGVAANSHIRAAIQELGKKYSAEVFLPPKFLCGDNGVMTGAQGYFEYLKGGNFNDLSLNAYATGKLNFS